MRAVDRGESFLVTRNGKEVGELIPVHARRFVPSAQILAAFKNAPPIDAEQFRADLDTLLDQSPAPRA